MDAVPPGPEAQKGGPADSNSGTNMARAARNGDNVPPAACGWVCEGTHRSVCPGFTRVGALRGALAPCAPPSNARRVLCGAHFAPHPGLLVLLPCAHPPRSMLECSLQSYGPCGAQRR